MTSSDKTREPRSRGTLVTPHSNVDRYLAFAFGVIFFGVLLYLATAEKNPTPIAIRVYVTVLALAAGGIGAILPGFIEIKYKNIARAGGAVGLAALVYLNEPAISKNVPQFEPPTTPSEPVAEAFLAALATGDPDKSWALVSETGRRQLNGDANAWRELYVNTLKPLGHPTSRVKISQGQMESPPGVPPGLYYQYSYKTKYSNDTGFRQEIVVLRANAKNAWEVYTYQISLAQVN